MLIGIVSDTHDRLDSAECALQMLHARGVRHVVHCGDWTTPTSMRHIIEHAAGLGMTMSGVLGNNDRQIRDL
jgi:predicted phosphodiesterase